LPPLTFE
ncbi:putative GTP-binding protein Rit2, partial [Danaus plexippus plexippus]